MTKGKNVTTKSKTKRLSPRDAAKAASAYLPKRSLSWYDKISDEDREWCDEFKKEALLRTEIPMSALHESFLKASGIHVGIQSFRHWLKG